MSASRRNPSDADASLEVRELSERSLSHSSLKEKWFEDACDEPSAVLRVASARRTAHVDDAHHHGARRGHRRWILDADVQIDGGVARGVTLNASAGGLRVALSRSLETGTYVDVAVVRGAVALLSRASVVWSRQSGGAWLSGLAFTRPDERFVDARALARA